MTNYRAGYDFERRVSAALRGDGYWTMEARGSHGVADLVAVKPGQVVLVQCKRTSPVIPPAERARLLSVAAATGGVPVVAFMPGRTGVAFRRLTGCGPKDFVEWQPDEVAAAAS